MVIFVTNKATSDSINEFIQIIQNIEPARKLWETQFNIKNEYYDFSMKLLYIDEIFTGDGYLIIRTNDDRELKFLIWEDTQLKIFKSE